jgi:hypothetical protein
MKKITKLFLSAVLLMGSSIATAQTEIPNDSTSVELQEIVLVGAGVIDLASDRKTPVAVSTIKASTIQQRAVGNVEFSEAFKNTPSIYVSNQAGGFGDSQVFTRGFSQSNTAFLLNGQPINGMEDGKMYWSNWSGMSDVANAVQVQRGLGSSKLAISSVGGTVNIVSKTTDKKQGGYVRYMSGNDSYVKTTASYDSGLQDNGWAYSVLIDHWQAHRKYAVGTAGQGQTYFFSVGKKFNEKHSLNFLLTGSPQWHDQNFAQSKEFYAQNGIKANKNTGFYNGERFTERRNFYHKPIANINWDFKINDAMDLSTVLYGSWGRGGGTGGYGYGRQRYEDSQSNGNRPGHEIDFDAIQTENIASADEFGNGSKFDSYLRRGSMNNHNWYGTVINLNIDNGGDFTYNFGVDGRTYTGEHFKQVVDYLGLNGWDDQYNLNSNRPVGYVVTESFEADPWSALFNSADSGQRIDYDYSESINYVGGFGQVEYSVDEFSAFLQGSLSTQSYQRHGSLDFGDSGDSEEVNKSGYNIKGGVSFSSEDGAHAVFANGGLYSRQPFLDNIFDNVRKYNDLVDTDIENEEIIGFEAGYRYIGEEVRVNLDLYSTEWGNRFLSFGGQTDAGVDTFYRFSDVTQIHSGFEFDVQYNPMASALTYSLYGSLGDWKYKDSTPYQLFNDNSSDLIESGEINLSDVKVGQAPQSSFGLVIDWKATPRMTFYTNYNQYGNFYGFVDVEDAVQAGVNGVDYSAEKLNSYGLVDLGMSYKFYVGSNAVMLRANVYNLLDEEYIGQGTQYGYYFGNGTTWNASLQYRF